MSKPTNKNSLRAGIAKRFQSAQRAAVVEALRRHDGFVARAAADLGYTHVWMHTLIKRFELRPLIEKLRAARRSAAQHGRPTT